MSKILSLLTSLFLIFAALLTAAPVTAKTIEVGDNCTYQSIQAAINAAQEGDSVYIHAGTYSIDSSIIPKSNIEISGDQYGQTIIYTDSFSDINSESNPAMILLNKVSGVTIHDLIFKGPATSIQNQHENGGTASIGGLRESRNGIKVLDSKNIKIYDCKFTLLLSDGIRTSRSSNVQVKDCIIDCAGHDSISSYKSSNIKIDNCFMDQMINTCVRVYNTEDCSITNSTFKQSISGTGAGFIELEGRADDIAINHNLFTSSSDPVLFLANPAGGTVTINDNALYNVAGLRTSYSPYSVTQQDNTLFSTYQNFAAMGYGYNSGVSGNIISIEENGKETNEEKPEAAEEEIIIDCGDETSQIFENCTEQENYTIVSDLNSSRIEYIEFSISQAETAAFLANSSIQDLTKAKLLLNETEENNALAEKYLQAGQLKIKYAQEFLILSSQELPDYTEGPGVL
jgi:hypothetical protein